MSSAAHAAAEGVPTSVVRGVSGRAYFAPTAAVRNLSPTQEAVVSDLTRHVITAVEAQERVTDVVCDAREIGVSWNVIGFAIGTTGEAARQRFKSTCDQRAAR